jgi:hypothetical protein
MDSFLGVDFEAPEEEQVSTMVSAIKDYADALDDIGTPEGMPDDARDGMELLVDWADDLDPGDFTSIEDLENFGDQFSEEENVKGEAFFAYVEETCGGDPTDPEASPTDAATEEPTDSSTEMPEIPSIDPSALLTMDPGDILSMIPREYHSLIPSEYLPE